MKTFIIFLVIILGVIGICFLALNNFNLFKIIFPILFLFAIFFIGWMKFSVHKQYSRFTQNLVTMFNGKVIINNFSEKQVYFEYENEKFEYYHKDYYISAPDNIYPLSKDLLKIKSQSNFTLVFWPKTGNTIVGKTTDRIMALTRAYGCKEIDARQLPLFKEYRVFSNNEANAKSLFFDTDALRIFSEYKKSPGTYALEPPAISIQEGTVILKVDLRITRDATLFKKNLSDMT